MSKSCIPHDANDLDDAASIATEAKAFTDGRLARPDGFRHASLTIATGGALASSCSVNARPPTRE
jgi:hypothetical protein